MSDFDVYNSLYDATDIFKATEHHVNQALLRSWIKQNRIRTPLIDSVAGKPRLYWFANVAEIDILSQATQRGISFKALQNLGPSISTAISTTDPSSQVLLHWDDTNRDPKTSTIKSPTAASSLPAEALIMPDTGLHTSIVINLSVRISILKSILTSRLQERQNNDYICHPTLRDKLIELRRSHERDREIAEKIMSFA
ncbi:MAG: hypothetical protein ABL901_05310 [Hyphomicrobiaceae bacterium]